MRLLARFRRLLIGPYRELKRPTYDVDPNLEQRQDVARRILVADRRNVDKPVPRFVMTWPVDGNGSPV